MQFSSLACAITAIGSPYLAQVMLIAVPATYVLFKEILANILIRDRNTYTWVSLTLATLPSLTRVSLFQVVTMLLAWVWYYISELVHVSICCTLNGKLYLGWCHCSRLEIYRKLNKISQVQIVMNLVTAEPELVPFGTEWASTLFGIYEVTSIREAL
jgi:hypothetical protein